MTTLTKKIREISRETIAPLIVAGALSGSLYVFNSAYNAEVEQQRFQTAVHNYYMEMGERINFSARLLEQPERYSGAYNNVRRYIHSLKPIVAAQHNIQLDGRGLPEGWISSSEE